MPRIKQSSAPQKVDFGRYYKKKYVLDVKSELDFYEIMRDEILGERFVAMIQIPLSSVIGIKNQYQKGGGTLWNKINKKRLDFVICRKDTLEGLLAIELDGPSHRNRKRQERDAFVNELFKTIGFPLMRVPVQSRYDRNAIVEEMVSKMGLVRKRSKLASVPRRS
ncbi:MAG: DUF2726 domain-containing protein [Chloroflexi bacterium]|nr:MAG: DUF2726 domain-containing protein [Chloroflexota bacterium]MBL1194526.1 DUF2726 domain-containing protein [Chloroflexota bacterium]NOH11814.1 DUF2726 domain-containing protein [Chloroflexota bacterium]